MIEDRKSQVSIVALIAQNYAHIDIKKIYFNTNDERYVRRFESVLELLTVILLDQAVFVNSVACTGVFRGANPTAKEWLLLHLDNVVLNAFHISKVKDLHSLKEVLFDKILNYEV